jgi:hypothetical protein
MAKFRVEKNEMDDDGQYQMVYCTRLGVVDTAKDEVVETLAAPCTRKELRTQVQRLARLGKVEIRIQGKVVATGKIVGAHASGQTLVCMSVGPLSTWNGADSPIDPHWDSLTIRAGKGQVERVSL